MDIIQVSNLTKTYGKALAVDKVSFNIKKGEIFGLLGPNGAGKTTIISMLSTILIPTKGEIIIDNINLTNKPKDIRKKIGLVFQETIVDEDLSGYDNLDIHARLYGMKSKERNEKITLLLKLVGLEDVSKNKVSTYSGGMKRKLELIRGLINDPKILFLDEPTLGLDPQSRRNVWDYVLKLKKEKQLTIILTTHYMDEADILCDRVGIINKGKFVKISSSQLLKKSLKGDVIEIKLGKFPDTVFEGLKKLKFVNKCENYNGTIRVYVQYGERKVEKIIDYFKSKKIHINSILLKEPTLEDVFLHYTGEEFK